MYMTAYKYILNDPINKNKLIIVADSIGDLDSYWDKYLEKYPEEQKKMNQYREKQIKRIWGTSTFYSPLLASLFQGQNVKSSNTVLFFSEIIDSMLIASENFYDKKSVGEYYKFSYEAYMWGISYEYLFIFNEDGTLRDVFWHELILN